MTGRREYGSPAPSRPAKPNCIAVLFQDVAASKSSQSALDPEELELERLENPLLELDESLHSVGSATGSTVEERNASVTSLRLRIVSIVVHGCSGGILCVSRVAVAGDVASAAKSP